MSPDVIIFSHYNRQVELIKSIFKNQYITKTLE